MRSIGGNVDGHARLDHLLLAAEGEFNLAIEQMKHFLEVMAMRARATAMRYLHVD
jgi:hypothetical protein